MITCANLNAAAARISKSTTLADWHTLLEERPDSRCKSRIVMMIAYDIHGWAAAKAHDKLKGIHYL